MEPDVFRRSCENQFRCVWNRCIAFLKMPRQVKVGGILQNLPERGIIVRRKLIST